MPPTSSRCVYGTLHRADTDETRRTTFPDREWTSDGRINLILMSQVLHLPRLRRHQVSERDELSGSGREGILHLEMGAHGSLRTVSTTFIPR